jgi:hypothetical protein
MRKSGEHSLLDLYEKARSALKDSRTIRIAMSADSPNSGENIAKREKFGKAKRLATAALVRLKNKSSKDFWKIPAVLDVFEELSEFEKKLILAELPEEIRTALEAKRKKEGEIK